MTEDCLVLSTTARRYTNKDGEPRAFAIIQYMMPPTTPSDGTHGLPAVEARVPYELAEELAKHVPAVCTLAFTTRQYQGRTELSVTGASVLRRVDLASAWQPATKA